MEALSTMLRTQKDASDILMMKESFHQLGKLQEECSRELSDFQRENFIAQEEFRAISSHLFQEINDFHTRINAELDKITLRINRLEIIAMYAFNIKSTKVITSNRAICMACSQNYIALGIASGDIRVYQIPGYNQISSTTRSNYDPLTNFGKITCMHAQDHLFVGFNNGMIIAFEFENLEVPHEMKYHQSAITAFHQFGDYFASGCNDGVVVLWNATTFERLIIVPLHRLPISSITDDGTDWIVADRTGMVSTHNQLFSKHSDKFSLCPTILYLFSQGPDRYITISNELLTWEGRRRAKTFNAVPVGAAPICCLKPPEMILLGSRQSNELRFIFLESLLFPKTIDVLDSPPLSIVHQNSIFYILTKNGNVYTITPDS
ncbi:hypothetical protein TRFO_25039 [Tritrichomonas foetus]|uniref:Anaphase-promoting complex subunit 4 WD40 domain-containing protein n=1 Tax=Tritrichomonas foetus TaxID=1144522 RepID=A0A1J4K618_9EUKA|nr:hypothetical protein TRFO_25039 [Tritrichomonas foetus]|eukprot:OHT06863.1 hypothetical protein TRFO_25039 [Tritrichomonas foetus]